ncbi:MAG: LPS-assembly protein LptD [Vicinamibacterales bacterium]
MPRYSALPLLVLLAALAAARPAVAQVLPGWNAKQFTLERLDADRVRLGGQVEIVGEGPNAGQQIFADTVEWNLKTGEFVAEGNVVMASPEARLSAERVVFNTQTKLGTFYTASGIASLGERAQQDLSMFGTLEPDVYFYGREIEKIGPDRYRLHQGAFTTCVQPTPRWAIVSSTATIDVGDYAVLKNAVLRVKDVPLFYLPILYYPIQDDDRATGFLIPTYGRSTYAGQSVSNAFFWAINRSQDLTLFHDWYFSTGQGMGSEYRYAAAPGSTGNLTAYWLREKARQIDNGTGSPISSPDSRSYKLNGSLSQRLPGGLRATGRVDYFSDIATQQLYNQDIYQSTNRQRLVTGSVSGAWSGLSLTGSFQRNELFLNNTDSLVNGSAPSLRANLSSQKLGSLPLYLSVNSEASRVLYINRQGEGADFTETDRSMGRVDVTPTLRSPLTNFPFLAVNATLAYRYTYYSQSLDEDGAQVAEPLSRRYAQMSAEVLGPVFTKVYTPGNAFADRLKHVVEPNFSVQRTTSIDNQDSVVLLGSSYDFVVGGVTRMTYGLTNRFLVRRTPANQAAPPAASAPREFLSASLSQSYYTDERASQADQTYQSASVREASKFSPIALTVRTQPTQLSSATVRVEYDHEQSVIQALSAQGGLQYPNTNLAIGWSRRRLSDVANNDALNASTTLKFRDGAIGGTYAFDWDISRGTVLQQRWIGYYNAQCCGIVVEYQEYNYNFGTVDPRFPPKNRRFNISFSLAGIGTFSNLFGAFGGSQF